MAEAALMMTLKPDKLKVSKKGDPDVLLAEFTEYVRKFGVFIAACGLDRDHVAGADDAHAGCATCRRILATFKCVGQDEVMQLLEYTGNVEDGDKWDTVKTKVINGIKAQTNKSSAVFKLFMEMPQNGTPFVDWYPQLEKQADKVDWDAFGRDDAVTLAIMYQTDNKKLKNKILAESLTKDRAIKMGLATEQSNKRLEAMAKNGNGRKEDDDKDIEVRELKEQIAALNQKYNKFSRRGGKSAKTSECWYCIRETHGSETRPAKNMECFTCGRTGHMRGSRACKGKAKGSGRDGQRGRGKPSSRQKAREVRED